MNTPKNLLIVGHTRSGGHFLMNSISMNFYYYVHHRSGADFHRKAKADKKVDKIIKEKTNIIQIARQQYYTYKDYADELKNNWIVLYILRDGKDVMASLFDMHYKEYNWTECDTLGAFLKAPMGKRSYEQALNIRPAKNPIDSWLMHWKSWLEYFDTDENNLPENFIKYEDLYYSFDKTINKIAGLLNMKSNQMLDRPSKDFNSIRPRKGCPGQWRESFTKTDKKYFNNYILEG